MAADSTLVEGAYRANRYIDLGERAAKQGLMETLGGINIPIGKGGKDTGSSGGGGGGSKSTGGGSIPTGDNTVSPDQHADIKDNEVQLNQELENQELLNTNPDILSEEEQEQQENIISEENADEVSEDVEENPTTSADTDNMNNNLLDLKQQYYDAVKSGDNNLAEQILSSVDTTADELDGWKQEISSTAANWTNRSKEGGVNTPRGFGMSMEKNPEVKRWFSDFINSGEKMQTKNTGSGIEQGIVGPDGTWMTKNQYKKLKESYEVDNESFNALNEISQGYYDMGSEGGPEDTWNNNMAMKVQNQVSDIVDRSLESGNSIIYDSNFGGTSFFDDMIERDQLKGTPYSHLGIDASAFDTDGDGRLSVDDQISDEDRRAIYEAAMKSDLLKDDRRQWLTNYFTEHVKRNYNASHNIIASRHSTPPEDLSSAEIIDLK